MKRNIISILFIAIVAAAAAPFASAAPVIRINEIKSPLLSKPVFVKPGETFTITLASGPAAIPVSAELVSSRDAAAKTKLTLGEARAAAGQTAVSATVPADAKDGLYDLTVCFAGGRADTQPHSVAVVSDMKSDFDFVHLTDIHFNLARVSNEARLRLLHDINKLAPAFAVFGGDVGLNPEVHDRDYTTSYEFFRDNLFVPMFTVPGNHELYSDPKISGQPSGREYWAFTYGPEYNSFDYGGLHVVGVNTFDWPDALLERWNPEVSKLGLSDHACIGAEQWEWLKADLAAASEAGKQSVIYTHVPVELLMGGQRAGKAKIPGPSFQAFIRVLKNNNARNVFAGHVHQNAERPLNDAVAEIITMGAGTFIPSGVEEWGYRIVHVRGGKVAGWDIKKFTAQDNE